MKAKTFIGDEDDEVVVEIVSRYTTPNTFKCRYRDKDIMRHRDRLTPLDDEAKEFLAK